MLLPDSVLAFKLLDNASLNMRDRQLALAACGDIKYETMKSALKRSLSDHSGVHQARPCGSERFSDRPVSYSGTQIKEETGEVLVTESGRYRSRMSSGCAAKQKTREQDNRGTNPMNKYGKRSRCAACGSVFRRVKDCPDKIRVSPQSVNVLENSNKATN